MGQFKWREIKLKKEGQLRPQELAGSKGCGASDFGQLAPAADKAVANAGVHNAVHPSQYPVRVIVNGVDDLSYQIADA
jgi:hypothetical protein